MKKNYIRPVAIFEFIEEDLLCAASPDIKTNTTDYTNDPAGNYSDIVINDKPLEDGYMDNEGDD